MKQYLETIQEPNLENLTRVKSEIERIEAILAYNHYLLGENLSDDNREKIEASIKFEEEFLKEANEVKVKIATVLSNLDIVYYE